jgi:hypothetical protein
METILNAYDAIPLTENHIRQLKALTGQGHLILHGSGRGAWYGLA